MGASLTHKILQSYVRGVCPRQPVAWIKDRETRSLLLMADSREVESKLTSFPVTPAH